MRRPVRNFFGPNLDFIVDPVLQLPLYPPLALAPGPIFGVMKQLLAISRNGASIFRI